MTSQPDKLFREKLENFQKPAPAAAWQRVEASLEKTDSKGLWLKIAASLTLLAVATFLLWPSENSTESTLADSKGPSKPAIQKSNPVIEKAEQSTPHSQSIASEPVKEEKNSIIKKEKTIQPVLVAQVAIETTIQNSESINKNPETISTSEVIIVQNTSVEEPIIEAHSITIKYSANEVNAKFLKKDLKESVAQATSEEKKTSGIQKLVSLAYDLKNSDSGLGDLRQKKNEILALNFRDNKQKQN